ncbi:PREDICTED: 39S ribosomal protein L32, mitochondrial isoform X1 [Crocodylus porosus]|uniref:Large ribosomal subunit protein bL32m n=1 Tax=Crocodylus porosus TaxID=8502 RepID=A0A7M4EZU0_CROPO|nr:PREDICTED: 39S ribosomal protein L32, mitochondrial isoform X1 [Crocodylus porosus]
MAARLVVGSTLAPLRGFLRRCWGQLWRAFPDAGQTWAPALAVQAPAALPELTEDVGESNDAPSFLDNIFWMAAPKSRRTIEVNRCRRRNPRNMIKLKTNIDVCPKCGNVKLKHVLCKYCYTKVQMETSLIRAEIKKKEGGPFNTPTVETLVLYQGEKPREQDQGKRIIERNRKRPSWFPLN